MSHPSETQSKGADRHRRTTMGVVLLLGLVAASCGGSGPQVHDLTAGGSAQESPAVGELTDLGAAHGSVVKVIMTDFAFVPETSIFEVGETVVFDFNNAGAIPHDTIIGTEEEAIEHAEEMVAKMTGAETAKEEEEEGKVPGIDLAPGRSGTLEVTFTDAGDLVMACTWPGHLEAGMILDIAVTE